MEEEVPGGRIHIPPGHGGKGSGRTDSGTQGAYPRSLCPPDAVSLL